MGAEAKPQEPRPIRRYGNRKLYDPASRRYVTLGALGALIAAGHEIQVVDQRSGEDLTNATLALVLLDTIKRGAGRIPAQVLTRLIRLAGGPAGAWQAWPQPQDIAGRAREEAERIVTRLLGRGLSLDDAVSLRHELGQLVHRRVADAQVGVEARLRALVEKGGNVTGRSLEAIRGGLETLEGSIERSGGAHPPRSRTRTTRRRR